MRLYNTILSIVAFIALVAFCGCERASEIRYDIAVNDVDCTHDEQTLTISYMLHEAVDITNISVSAACDADWVTIVNTSEIGCIEVHVDENFGDKRKATITLSAPSHSKAKIELCQWDKAPETAKHTLIYYFFGTSLSRYFRYNLEDAAEAIETGILGNNNRVVFFRQVSTNSGYIGELYYDITSRECIERRIEDITLSNSVISPEEIGERIAKMAKIAPAERYGIVIAGHGQGWITRELLKRGSDISAYSFGNNNPWIPAAGAEITRAIGEDNVRANIDELAKGIEYSGVELDYILFDACFMSNIEAIYELRNSANYIIASPCEIMGNGFPYHRTLPYLFVNYGETTDYVGAAKSYHEFYKNEFIGSQRSGSVALFDCSQIETLADATSEVMKSAKSDYDATQLQAYEGNSPHFFYDFGQWVNVVATDDAALARFNAAMSECVVATYTLDSYYTAYGSYGIQPIDLDVYTGVTTSAPSTAYPNGWRETNWYKDVIGLEN